MRVVVRPSRRAHGPVSRPGGGALGGHASRIDRLRSLRKTRLTMSSKRAKAVDYAQLVAHGYREPDLEADAADRAQSTKTAAPLDPPDDDTPADPVLVCGEGGRWKLVPAPGDTGPPPKLQRPGADQVAAVRKRRLAADVTELLGKPGAVFDVGRVRGTAASEAKATAAARRRLADKRLATALRQSRTQRPGGS